jgi:hypothetical protein
MLNKLSANDCEHPVEESRCQHFNRQQALYVSADYLNACAINSCSLISGVIVRDGTFRIVAFQ